MRYEQLFAIKNIPTYVLTYMNIYIVCTSLTISKSIESIIMWMSNLIFSLLMHYTNNSTDAQEPLLLIFVSVPDSISGRACLKQNDVLITKVVLKKFLRVYADLFLKWNKKIITFLVSRHSHDRNYIK